MRLAKYLAAAGVASRRKSEQIIAMGRVEVNGAVITVPQHRVETGDLVTVDGREVRLEQKCYLLLDKPAGFLSTVSDPHGRPTVLDLVGRSPTRLYPVGRLDLDTTGLLLLTNDGELAYRLTHPRFGVKKRYQAWVKGIPAPAVLHRMARGVLLEEGMTAPAKVRLLRQGRGRALLEIVLIEGRKRQVKRICAACGHPVERLRRSGFAFLTAEGLESGAFRPLSGAEVRRLYRLVGLPLACLS
ncbi:MAG: pseudouridine synthase [Bacillota bacterium]|nr:pseudouridine synthase [Bacillota bacterium]